jgi:hypothetical protein
MIERLTASYNRLFEVRLLHHYWLDEGATVFDKLAAAKQNQRLLTYDVRPTFGIAPAASTQTLLANLGCVFKATGLGFIVGAPQGTAIAADIVFSFVVSVQDANVFAYTALTMRPQAIYMAFDPNNNSPDRIAYRYKENVPVLSNLTGVTGSGAFGAMLFLSRGIPPQNGGEQAEALVLSGAALAQFTGDDPSPTQQIDANASAQPVYVNQSDAPIIVPPSGVTGAPTRGVQLSDDVTDNVFALITLTAVRAGNAAFSFVDGAGAAKTPSPVYQVRFKNRSTLWIYLNKQTGVVTSTEAAPLPLTYFGNAGAKQKPSRGLVKALENAGKITQLVSEIYV